MRVLEKELCFLKNGNEWIVDDLEKCQRDE